MSWLVVADPPHPGPDLKAISKLLSVLPMEMKGRLNAPVSEAWSVLPDEAAAEELARGLAGAGARCRAIAAANLASVPHAEEIRDFGLEPQGVSWPVGGGKTVLVRWADVKAVVLYRREALPPTERRGGGEKPYASKFATAMGGVVGVYQNLGNEKPRPPPKALPDDTLELAGTSGKARVRARFAKTKLHWNSLGAKKQAGTQQNWNVFLKLVADSTPSIEIDQRGVDARLLRPTTIGGVPLSKLLDGEGGRVLEVAQDPYEFFATFFFLGKGIRVE